MMQRDTQATGKQLSVFWECNETCSQRSLAGSVASDFLIFAKYNHFIVTTKFFFILNIIAMFINEKTFSFLFVMRWHEVSKTRFTEISNSS